MISTRLCLYYTYVWYHSNIMLHLVTIFPQVKWLINRVKGELCGNIQLNIPEKRRLSIQCVSLTWGLERLSWRLKLDSLRLLRSVYKPYSIYHVNTRLLRYSYVALACNLLTFFPLIFACYSWVAHVSFTCGWNDDTPTHENNMSNFSKYKPHHKHKQEPRDVARQKP